MPRLESTLEKELVRRVKKRKGLCIKLTGYKHIPDRLILLPGKEIYFFEVKSDTGEPEYGQLVYIETLQKLGFPAAVINSYETLDQYIPR